MGPRLGRAAGLRVGPMSTTQDPVSMDWSNVSVTGGTSGGLPDRSGGSAAFLDADAENTHARLDGATMRDRRRHPRSGAIRRPPIPPLSGRLNRFLRHP